MTSTYTSAGIILDRYADILARLDALAIAKWGEGIDLDRDAYDGHMNVLIATLQGEMNEILQAVYDGRSVSNATGAALDAAVSLVGLERAQAAESIIQSNGVQLTASRATTVPAGSIYKTSGTNISFATDTELIIPAAGTGVVNATCTVEGANNVAIGELDTIVTSVPGITGVTNTVAATPGRLRQTDTELKLAHSVAVSTSGEDDIAGIFEALQAVDGVSAVYGLDNDTPLAIGSVPAGTIYLVVIGGTDQDVATAISNNKTSGVPTYGSENVTVYNETTSQAKVINFDRGADVSIYIKINITKQAGLFPDDGENTIKEAYAEMYTNNQLNQDLIYNEHYTPIFSVSGVTLNNMYLDTVSPATGTSDITMTPKQRGVLDVVRDSEGALTSINVEIVTST